MEEPFHLERLEVCWRDEREMKKIRIPSQLIAHMPGFMYEDYIYTQIFFLVLMENE